MFDLTEVHSLTDFQRNAKEHVKRLKRTGKAQVLTINGKAAVVVQDAKSYQKMLDEKERLEAINAVNRGMDDVKAGRSRPLKDVMRELRRKYESPGRK